MMQFLPDWSWQEGHFPERQEILPAPSNLRMGMRGWEWGIKQVALEWPLWLIYRWCHLLPPGGWIHKQLWCRLLRGRGRRGGCLGGRQLYSQRGVVGGGEIGGAHV